jgi:SAM-dependent methyltransferase
MTDWRKVGFTDRMTFHSPISEERAARIVAELASRLPGRIVDYGCGWGELMLRIAEAVPDAQATGVDIFAPDIVRGREAAAERGLAHRVTFIEGPAAEHATPADLVLNSGSYQAFGGGIEEALKALRPLVNPGGRLFFGAEYWEYPPSDEQLANMWPGITRDDCLFLPEIVHLAVAAGFRPLAITSATRGEWEEFESRMSQGAEEWLLANGDDEDAPAVLERLDTSRNIWLRGHREVFGFAMLTLGVPD